MTATRCRAAHNDHLVDDIPLPKPLRIEHAARGATSKRGAAAHAAANTARGHTKARADEPAAYAASPEHLWLRVIGTNASAGGIGKLPGEPPQSVLYAGSAGEGFARHSGAQQQQQQQQQEPSPEFVRMASSYSDRLRRAYSPSDGPQESGLARLASRKRTRLKPEIQSVRVHVTACGNTFLQKSTFYRNQLSGRAAHGDRTMWSQ